MLLLVPRDHMAIAGDIDVMVEEGRRDLPDLQVQGA